MHYYSIPGFATASQKRTPEQIIQAVSDYFDIPVKYIKCKARKREYVVPRFMAMYLMRIKTELSLMQIAQFFDNRHHTTVMNAIEVVKDLEFSDKAFKNQLSELKFLLK